MMPSPRGGGIPYTAPNTTPSEIGGARKLSNQQRVTVRNMTNVSVVNNKNSARQEWSAFNAASVARSLSSVYVHLQSHFYPLLQGINFACGTESRLRINTRCRLSIYLSLKCSKSKQNCNAAEPTCSKLLHEG